MERTIKLYSKTSDEAEDARIISDIKSGSRNAKNQLCLKYYKDLTKMLRKYCFSSIPVELVVTDAIMFTIEKIIAEKYNDQGKILGYMYTIGKNLCSEIQRRKIKDIVEYTDMIHQYSNETDDIGQEMVFDRELLNCAKEALGKLDKTCKELLILVFYDGLKPREIIKIMSEFEETKRISNRKDKCIQKLRKEFGNIVNAN